MFEQVPKLPGSRFTSLRAVYQAVVAAILIAMVHLMSKMSDLQRKLLCDPQTSGGLLLAVMPEVMRQVQSIAERHGIQIDAIGELHAVVAGKPLITDHGRIV